MVYTEKMRKAQKKYRKNHREELREKGRRRYNENYVSIKERKNKLRRKNYKKWILKNREKERKRLREWRRNHKESENKRGREFYWKNHERELKRGKNYRKRNTNYNRKRNKEYYWKTIKQQRIRSKIRIFRLKFLSLQKISKRRIPKCKECGNTDIRILSKHHKNGLGKEKREERLHLDRNILNGKRKTNDLEVLCYNCNILHEYKVGRRFFDRKLLEKDFRERGIIRNSDKIK